MPDDYVFTCKCGWSDVRYRNFKKCPKCGKHELERSLMPTDKQVEEIVEKLAKEFYLESPCKCTVETLDVDWKDEFEHTKNAYRNLARSFFKDNPELYLKVLPDDVTTTIGVIPARNYFFIPISSVLEEEK